MPRDKNGTVHIFNAAVKETFEEHCGESYYSHSKSSDYLGNTTRPDIFFVFQDPDDNVKTCYAQRVGKNYEMFFFIHIFHTEDLLPLKYYNINRYRCIVKTAENFRSFL